MVVRETLVLVSIGAVLGTLASLAANTYLAGQLFGVTPRDPFAIGVALTLLGIVTPRAGYLRNATPAASTRSGRCGRSEDIHGSHSLPAEAGSHEYTEREYTDAALTLRCGFRLQPEECVGSSEIPSTAAAFPRTTGVMPTGRSRKPRIHRPRIHRRCTHIEVWLPASAGRVRREFEFSRQPRHSLGRRASCRPVEAGSHEYTEREYTDAALTLRCAFRLQAEGCVRRPFRLRPAIIDIHRCTFELKSRQTFHEFTP